MNSRTKSTVERWFVILACCLMSFSVARADDAKVLDAAGKWQGERPNVLWIMIEDWSTDLSCYGTPLVQTPNIDKLADQGIRFDRAYTTSPVCSTSRSAMMTGFHQNYIGAHQHRTAEKKPLPYGIKPGRQKEKDEEAVGTISEVNRSKKAWGSFTSSAD